MVAQAKSLEPYIGTIRTLLGRMSRARQELRPVLCLEDGEQPLLKYRLHLVQHIHHNSDKAEDVMRGGILVPGTPEATPAPIIQTDMMATQWQRRMSRMVIFFVCSDRSHLIGNGWRAPGW